MTDEQTPAPLGTAGRNTISRAELGAYYRRLGEDRGGDAAAAVFDDIAAHRKPYETAGETATPADQPPPVAADLESRIADLENTIGQATVMVESMADGGRLDPDCALRLLSTLGTSPRDLEAIGTGPLLDPDCRAGKCGSCTGAPCEHECHTKERSEEGADRG